MNGSLINGGLGQVLSVIDSDMALVAMIFFILAFC